MSKLPSGVLGSGALSFVRLPDGRRIFARWHKLRVDQGPGWSPELVHRFTLELDGRELRLVDQKTGKTLPHLSLDEGFLEGRTPLPLQATASGRDRSFVRYSSYYSHHLGSVTSDITLAIDTAEMLAVYSSKDDVDIDR